MGPLTIPIDRLEALMSTRVVGILLIVAVVTASAAMAGNRR